MNAWAFGPSGDRGDRHLGLVLPRMRPMPHHSHHHRSSHDSHHQHNNTVNTATSNDSSSKPVSSLEGIILPLFLAERIPYRQVVAICCRLLSHYFGHLRNTHSLVTFIDFPCPDLHNDRCYLIISTFSLHLPTFNG